MLRLKKSCYIYNLLKGPMEEKTDQVPTYLPMVMYMRVTLSVDWGIYNLWLKNKDKEKESIHGPIRAFIREIGTQFFLNNLIY